MSKRVISYLLLIVSFLLVGAQKPTKGMVRDMVRSISKLVEENYILEEKGKTIAEALRKDFRQGRFSTAKSLRELDSTLTKSLRESSDDYHLYTWNNKEIVAQLQSSALTEKHEEEVESVGFFNNKDAFDSNFGFEKFEIIGPNIGYLKLNQINISESSLQTLYAAMTMVKHTKALIIDLRNNSGGGSTVGSALESFFFDGQTSLLEFRSRTGETRLESTVPWLLEKRYSNPLYLLINKGTASAAEAFAFALKNQKRCVIVGESSSGGAYMNTYFPINSEFVVAISTAAPFLPGTDLSWQGLGVTPDHEVKESEALQRAIELIKIELGLEE